jgi:PAS domain-containing protein
MMWNTHYIWISMAIIPPDPSMRIVLRHLSEFTSRLVARVWRGSKADRPHAEGAGMCGLMDHIPAAVGVYDVDGTILYLNESARHLVREGLSNAIGTRIWDAFVFADAGRAQAKLAQCLKGAIADGASRDDIWLTPPGASDRAERDRDVCLDANVRPFQFDADGRVRNVVVFCTDVTARKRLERMLAEERQIGTELTQLAPVAVLLRDEHDRVVFINRLLEDLLGQPLATLAGRPWGDVVARRQPAAPDAEPVDPAKLPTTFETPEGAIRVVDWQERTLPDGTLRLSVGIDVTLQRAMQASLVEGQARLIEAQKLARVGSWVWDVAAGTITCSAEASLLMGRPPTEMTVTYAELMDSVHPDDRRRVAEQLDLALSGKSGLDVEHRIVRPDGTVAFARARAKVEFDLACKPLRMIGTTHDVTDQHLREAEILEREARLRFAAASAKMAVYVQDLELRYVWIVNCPLDRKEHEIIGRTDLELSGEAAAPLSAAKRRVGETGEAAAFDWEPTIDGRPLVFRIFV